MSILNAFRLRSGRFARDTQGSIPTEGVIISVALIWWYAASFQIFDAFHEKNINLKAAYTVADIISRQPQGVPIDADFIEGLNTLFDYLASSKKPTWLRVSSVYWDPDEARFEVAWSYATGTAVGDTTETLQNRAHRIPNMSVGDYVTIVETNMAYEPIFNIGIKAGWFTNFIPTRPRFAPCVSFDAKDGTDPACIYDYAIDTTDNVHVDTAPDGGT